MSGPLLSVDGLTKRFRRTGGIVAAVDDVSFAIEPGETLVLFTDGVTEAINPQFEQFGNTRLETLIDGAGDVPPAALLELIYEAVDEFAGGEEQADDITAVTLRLTPEAVAQPRPLPEAAAAA